MVCSDYASVSVVPDFEREMILGLIQEFKDNLLTITLKHEAVQRWNTHLHKSYT